VRPCLLDLLLQPNALQAAFQPVVDVSSSSAPPHYMEGLIRGPAGTNIVRPDVLFDYARRKGSELEVDRACIRALLIAGRELPGVSIGLNIHAATLATDLELLTFLGDLLTETGIAPNRLVVEIVERGEDWNQRAFLLNLDGLRSIGVRVALDDFGTGQANYRLLLDSRPDYLKVDRTFAHGCHEDARCRALLDSLARLAGRIGCRVVAEGIEDPADLEVVREAGIGLVQGYLWGTPAPASAWIRGPRGGGNGGTVPPRTASGWN
jgi:EAL domain-containing protein (putative c-di-GMP-specific phosphodiesterase class I)